MQTGLKKFALAAAAFVFVSCAPKVVNYSVSIVTQSCDSNVNPFSGVQFVRVTVSGDGITTPLTAISAASTRKIDVPDIPAGTNRVVEVRAYDGDPSQGGKIVSVGRSLAFTVPDVVPTDLKGPIDVSVILRKVNAFTPISSAANPGTCVKMNVARAGHTATLLKNGKVFIAGGYNYVPGANQKQALADTELFDPSQGTFETRRDISFTTSSGTVYKQERAYHTATLIPSSGQVVLWGGEVYQGTSSTPSPRASFLFYDPDVDEYGALPPRTPPAIPRSRHAVALDSNGKLLIVGGIKNSSSSVINEVEWLDPASTLYTIVSGANLPRLDMSVAHVQGNNSDYIAVAGGTDGTSLVTDVTFFQFNGTTFAQKSLQNPPRLSGVGRRAAGVGTLRSGADMLLMGGFTDASKVAPVASSEIVNAQSATVAAGPNVGSRGNICAVNLNDGSVMAIGGRTSDMTGGQPYSEKSTVIVTANASGGNATSPGPDLPTARWGHTCTLLADGSVLVTGGVAETAAGDVSILQDAYIYQPAPSDN